MNDYRSRWEKLELILREKLDISLPRAMRDNDIDMWIHVVKLGIPDPLDLDLGVGVALLCPDPSAGSTTYFIFTDRGDARIERAVLGGFTRQGDVYDIVGTEEDLKTFVDDRDPKRIAVNMSDWLAIADSLTHSSYTKLVDVLGAKYCEERLVSSEHVITDFRDRRVISEIVEYGQLAETTRQLIERALSNEVITPGITTPEDVGWWLKEQLLSLGIEDSFHRFPVPSIIYSGSPEFDGYPGPAPHTFQPGDLFQLDFGISLMNLGTDMKRTAYILRDEEVMVPSGVQHAWDQGLKARSILREHIKVGQTGEETLSLIGNALEAAGFVFVNQIHNSLYFEGGWDGVWNEALAIRGVRADELNKTQVSIDCHCVGNTGDSQIEQGPAISGFRTGRSHLTIKANHLFAFELFANSPIPEWGQTRVRLGLEDDAIVTEEGVQFLYPPNNRILLIR